MQDRQQSESPSTQARMPILLADKLRKLQADMGPSPDLVIRSLELPQTPVKVSAVYLEGITDKALVDHFIQNALSYTGAEKKDGDSSPERAFFSYVREQAVTTTKEKVLVSWDELYEALLSGRTLILVDGLDMVLSAATGGGETRAVSEAATQVSIRGSKESFTETIGTNLALVRRRIRNKSLWIESYSIGAVTRTDVAIMYIKGIADDQKVAELKRKLNAIRVDSILESGYIEQLIEEKTYTPFPTIYNTERPDSVAGNLLDGRIAVFVDGTPFVLVVPTNFFMFLHTVEDYYQRFDFSTLIRLLRFMCLIISLFGPALFVAALNFHQEMIPTPLLINLAQQREGVPFPTFVEAILMEITFEIIREAGIRLPTTIGQTVSIIGGLVLGQAAVEAGIVSPAMVIVVSLTGICSFATPAFNLALSVRLLRFGIIIIAAFMGLYGIAISALILTAHLCSLRSFGTPFLSPVAPFTVRNQKDTVIRSPFYFMLTPKRKRKGQSGKTSVMETRSDES